LLHQLHRTLTQMQPRCMPRCPPMPLRLLPLPPPLRLRSLTPTQRHCHCLQSLRMTSVMMLRRLLLLMR
jgi:hypothetical protein